MSGSDLNSGSNDIRALWGGLRTQAVQISLKPASAGVLSNQFTDCQKTPTPNYCATLSVTLKQDTISKWTCSHWQEVMKAQKLNIDCSSTMQVGVGEVKVPKLDKDKWTNTLRQLPDVQQVVAN